MRVMSIFVKSSMALVVLSILAVGAFADTIRLKDGGIIKGRIVTFTGGRFIISIGDGSRKRQMEFSASEIESIQFEPVETSVAYVPPKKPVTKTPIIKTNIETSRADQRDDIESVTTVSPEKPSTASKKGDPSVTSTDRSPSVSAAGPPHLSTKATTPRSGNASSKPVELAVKVLADNTGNGWTNSGWMVRKGQKIRITGDGRVSLGNGKFATPAGDPGLNDENKLLKSVATGALIAVIGDDNNEFIYIGASREFTAKRDGSLFLGVNEGNLNDNAGSFDVKVEILPGDAE